MVELPKGIKLRDVSNRLLPGEGELINMRTGGGEIIEGWGVYSGGFEFFKELPGNDCVETSDVVAWEYREVCWLVGC